MHNALSTPNIPLLLSPVSASKGSIVMRVSVRGSVQIMRCMLVATVAALRGWAELMACVGFVLVVQLPTQSPNSAQGARTTSS